MKTRTFATILFGVGMMLSSPHLGRAADAPKNATQTESKEDLLTTTAKGWNFDQPIPASPAFTALGVTPETITHPATPRELGTSLVNGVDKDGSLKAGVAVDVAPYQLFFGAQTSLSDYESSSLTQILYNTQLSVATAEGGDKEKKSRNLAVGLQLTVFNKGDLRLSKAIKAEYQKFADDVQFTSIEVTPDMTDAQIRAQDQAYVTTNAARIKSLNTRIQEIRAETWAASSLYFAAAPAWKSASGKADELRSDGATYWATYAWGFEGVKTLHKRAQFLLHARYRERETVTDETTPTITYKQNSSFVAARLRFGKPDLHFSIEGGRVEQRPRDRRAIKIQRIGGTLEYRLRENLWLVVSAGDDVVKSSTGKGGGYTLAGLRFGTAETPGINLGK